MFPPLPQAPPPPQAIMGHQGQQPYPAPGTTGVQPSAVGQIAEGLDKFMKSYFGSKTAVQEHYKQKFTDAVSGIREGLYNPQTVDYEEIMKWGKKAGLPLRTEAPTPQETQYHEQQKAYDSAMASQNSLPANVMNAAAQPSPVPGMGQMGVNPGMQSLLMQGAPGVQVGPPQAPPPQAQPGFLDKLKGMVGMSQAQRAPVSMQSPTGQYLQALAQASQAGAPMNPTNVAQQGRISQMMANMEEKSGIPLKQAGMNTQRQLLQLGEQARMGDPQAIDMAVRSGIMKNVGIDEIASLFSHTAPPGTPPEEIYGQAGKMALFGHFGLPMMTKMQEWAKDLMPRFVGQPDPAAASRSYVQSMMNGTQPTAKPGRTMEEMKTYNDSLESVMKHYPTLPVAYANALNMATLVGDNEGRSKIMEAIGKLPRDGTIKANEFNQTHGLAEWTAKSKMALDVNQLQLNVIDTALKAQGQEGAEIGKMLDSKDDVVRASGIERMKNLDWKGSMIKIPIPNPSDPAHPFMYPVKDPTRVVGDSAGWLNSNLNPFHSASPYLAPLQAPPVPNQGRPQAPGMPSTPFDPNSVPDWNKSSGYALPDPFEGLSPELVEVLKTVSHPNFKNSGPNSEAVRKWRLANGVGQ